MGKLGLGLSDRVVAGLVITVLCLPALSATVLAQFELVPYYYISHGCPNAVDIITDAFAAAYNQNSTAMPGVLRIHFHDCFVNGCDSSVLIDGPGSERDAIPNQTLQGFEAIDAAKAAVEAKCPGIVSCADILALGAEIAVQKMSGGSIFWDVPLGRRDGLVSDPNLPLTSLPPPTANVADLKRSFSNVGLSTEQMVTLSGAHSVGRAHCGAFQNRLTPTVDPNLDPAYAAFLNARCPTTNGAPSSNVVNLDVTTPTKLDEVYYKNLQNKKGLLTSDENLQLDLETRVIVAENAFFPTFAFRFRSAMIAMGNINVKTGSEGEHQVELPEIQLISGGSKIEVGTRSSSDTLYSGSVCFAEKLSIQN